MSNRAPALPAAERRAAIVAATLPLLRERGSAISTRDIANAAEIAEGTIFRVFPDKDAVISAAIEAALDPAPLEVAFQAIDRNQPFEDQLIEAVRIMQKRLAEIWNLVEALGERFGPKSPPADHPGLEQLFGTDGARKRVVSSPQAAARQLRALTLAMSHPLLFIDGPVPAEEIVSLLLDGIRDRNHAALTVPAPPTTPRTARGKRC